MSTLLNPRLGTSFHLTPVANSLESLDNRTSTQLNTTDPGHRSAWSSIMQLFPGYNWDEIQALSNQVKRLQATLSEKERLNQALAAQNTTLLANHNQLRAEFALSKQSNSRQAVHIGTGNFVNSSKVCDSDIIGQWKQLAYNIRALAHHLTKSNSMSDFGKGVYTVMRSVFKEYEPALDHEGLKPLIIQAYIWRVVNADVWEGKKNVRNGDAHYLLRQTSLSLPAMNVEDISSMKTWIARGFAHLTILEPIKKRALERLLQHRAFNLLRGQNPSAQQEAYQQLHEIYEGAIELDTMFLTSRAEVVRLWDVTNSEHYEVACDVTTDGKVNEMKNTPVSFLISPALQKWGNANGQDYNKSLMLAKASVVVGC
ncbi:hypothetical protein HJFPF1_00806 [Paramyrothecium foliicola]|nr:hypothetical protein HJFPF1_00806 [Paramyrothecium foliicola]